GATSCGPAMSECCDAGTGADRAGLDGRLASRGEDPHLSLLCPVGTAGLIATRPSSRCYATPAARATCFSAHPLFAAAGTGAPSLPGRGLRVDAVHPGGGVDRGPQPVGEPGCDAVVEGAVPRVGRVGAPEAHVHRVRAVE